MTRHLLLLSIVSVFPALAQAHFEVSSIRPAAPETTARDARSRFEGDRFDAKAMTVGDILDMLNGFRLFRVVGGPPWMKTDRFDIAAKADRELKGEDREPALMALLAERFLLQTHKETRELPGFVLQAPKDAKTVTEAKSGERYSLRPNDQGDPTFVSVSMPGLANYLSQMLRAPVVDETGLTGGYDFVLPTSQVQPVAGMNYGDRVREAAEQVGFRLTDRKIRLEVTVVDRCERPSGN